MIENNETNKVVEIIENFRLDYKGFPSLNKIREKITNYDTIFECITIIPTVFEPVPSRTHHLCNSYKGKHIIEEKIGSYISNGELIVSMIYLGYKFMLIPKSLNCVFYCKEKKK